MKFTMKTVAVYALVASLAAALPQAASARPFGGGGPGMGPGYAAMAPEKQAALDTIMREHAEKIQPLRDRLWAQETTLRALSANPNTTPDQISALVNDMGKLREQLRAERKAQYERIRQEVGVDAPFMGGFGGARGGYGGRGYHGGARGGYGGCGGFGWR